MVQTLVVKGVKTSSTSPGLSKEEQFRIITSVVGTKPVQVLNSESLVVAVVASSSPVGRFVVVVMDVGSPSRGEIEYEIAFRF